MSPAADPSAASEDVLLRRAKGVLVVTINRPGQRNAVNGAVSAGIARALDLLDGDTGPLAAGFERQRAYLEPVFASQDPAEGVAAFRERRDPVWQDQ